MRSVTTVKVQRGRRAPYWVVAGVFGLNRQSFTDKIEADRYALTLAFGTADQFALAG